MFTDDRDLANLTVPQLLAAAAVKGPSGETALRMEDVADSGDPVPQHILSQINMTNSIEAFRPFFGVNSNGDVVLRVAIDGTALT